MGDPRYLPRRAGVLQDMRPAVKEKPGVTQRWSDRLGRTRSRVDKIWSFAYFVFGLQVFSLTWASDPDTVSRYLTMLGFGLLIYVFRHGPNFAKVVGVVVFLAGAQMSMVTYGLMTWVVSLAALVGLIVALTPAWPQSHPWLPDRASHNSRDSSSWR